MIGRSPRGPSLAAGAVGALLALAVLAAGADSLGALQQSSGTFPHVEHEGLFPLCTGCHEGIRTTDRAAYYPAPEACGRCHDGVELSTVEWSPPEREPGNLRFEHAEHARGLEREGDAAQDCTACHTPPGAGRMEVSEDVQLGTCFGCHEHQANEHLVDARCRRCHTPLARSGLSLMAIEALPTPADHEDDAFVPTGHGAAADASAARCATCHTADRCSACHVDADREEIQALGFAPEGMELGVMTAYYPEPATHADDGWLDEHGARASRDACATCHTRDDCSACHMEPLPTVAAGLPTRAQSLAPGAYVEGRAPGSHESLFFLDVHSALAATDPGNCSTCHEDSFCVSCHEGPSDGGYHPPDFVARHPATAFGRETECASCHSAEAFCRECHAQSGLTGFGRLGPGYHSAGAFWLIRHGQAARQGLESCVSCHKQTDCTQCHGLAGAFKVSPHGEDFDARSAWERSPRTCIACHLRNPLNGSSP